MISLVLPNLPEEDRLLDAAQHGSQDAVMQIYEQYFPAIYQFIRFRVEDIATAEDIASDVFLRLVEALRGDNPPRHSLRGWLFQVARNELYRHFGRKEPITTETLEDWLQAPDGHDPEAQLIKTLDVERARQLIRMLGDEQQEVLILRFGQALSLKETADIMGKSVSAVKSLQFRAVNTLRDILREPQARGENG